MDARIEPIRKQDRFVSNKSRLCCYLIYLWYNNGMNIYLWYNDGRRALFLGRDDWVHR